jgi:outer membrane protein, multidrug efflux system
MHDDSMATLWISNIQEFLKTGISDTPTGAYRIPGVAGFESVSASDWFAAGSRFWSAGPTVQWWIFDAGRIRANIKVQNAQQEEALAVDELTALTAFGDVENGLVAHANEHIRRRSLDDAVRPSRKSFDLTDFLHVLDAERSLYQAQDALVQSGSVSTYVIALYKSLGGGWESFEKQPAPSLAQNTIFAK